MALPGNRPLLNCYLQAKSLMEPIRPWQVAENRLSGEPVTF